MFDEKCRKVVQAAAERAWRKMKGCSLAEGKDLGALPEVRFKKLRGFYGLAYPDHFELDRNTIESLPEEELKVFLERTTIHELAHIAEYRVSKEMSHGPMWHAFDHAGGGVGLHYGYVLQEEDWHTGRNPGPAWAILQLICFCASVVLLTYAAKYFLAGISAPWLILPIIAVSLFGNVALDALFVRKDKNLEPFCVAKFLILVPPAVYLLSRM